MNKPSLVETEPLFPCHYLIPRSPALTGSVSFSLSDTEKHCTHYVYFLSLSVALTGSITLSLSDTKKFCTHWVFFLVTICTHWVYFLITICYREVLHSLGLFPCHYLLPRSNKHDKSPWIVLSYLTSLIGLFFRSCQPAIS